MCPSAPWDSEGAKVFGVVGGEVKRPRVLFLKQMLAPSKELEVRLNGVAPEEVFRVAAPCAGASCAHHNAASKGCNLVGQIVDEVDPVFDDYAVCGIRAHCVWWAQEGLKACVRCPQIATRNLVTSEQLARAAIPAAASNGGADRAPQ
ncbi:MAG TPA: nitrogen fixation protein [Janthinobacterium sp.]|nr:nitrogen fixation protein [Janthinobacterium sp.]